MPRSLWKGPYICFKTLEAVKLLVAGNSPFVVFFLNKSNMFLLRRWGPKSSYSSVQSRKHDSPRPYWLAFWCKIFLLAWFRARITRFFLDPQRERVSGNYCPEFNGNVVFCLRLVVLWKVFGWQVGHKFGEFAHTRALPSPVGSVKAQAGGPKKK